MQTNMLHTPSPWGDDDDDDVIEQPERFWTARRIALLIIALIIVISLLAEYIVPIVQSLNQPTPMPPFVPDAPRV